MKKKKKFDNQRGIAYMRESTRTNICSEMSCDASQDVTSPRDVSYDVGRVSANHRHDLKRLMPAANHIHRRQHPSREREREIDLQ